MTMRDDVDRRDFFKAGFAASAAGLGLSLEERVLLAARGKEARGAEPSAADRQKMPTGKLGDLTVSRIICGGNLIEGYAHSRDLLYVSELLKNYHTDEKILDTLELAEQHGVNMVNSTTNASPILNRYRQERGGKIQWLVQAAPQTGNLKEDVQRAFDSGADAFYIQGNVGDRMVRDGHVDRVGEVLEFMKDTGLPAGVGGHALAMPRACKKAGLEPDFYVKTLHSKDYWSAQRPDQRRDVVSNSDDNYWCTEPEETIAFMETIDKPWIAFKVLAAGAIPPERGFRYAFENGADFAMVGMFDFQIAEDAAIATKVISRVRRARPWRA